MSVPSFSSSQFYGKNRKRKKERSVLASLELNKVPAGFPHRILGPTSKWRTFHRQNEAFSWAKNTAEDLLVFAFESGDLDNGSQMGKRRYLVTSLPVFWHYYNQLEPCKRHHYEIIPEGCPCKLYFDLEFMNEYNPGHEGNRMVDILIKYVCLWLEMIFGISCNRSSILDLDASTSSKFSRHLIFHLDNAVFENCVVAGNFVRHIFSLLMKYIESQRGICCKDGQMSGTLKPACSSLGTHTAGPVKDQSQLLTLSQSSDGFSDTDEAELSSLAEQCEQSFSQLSDFDDGTCKAKSGLKSDQHGKNVRYAQLLEEDTVLNNSTGKKTISERDQDRINSKSIRQSSSTDVELKLSSKLTDRHLRTDSNQHPNFTLLANGKKCSRVAEDCGGEEEQRKPKVIVDPVLAKIIGQFSPVDLQSLIVTNKDGNKTLFCDLGVYTKNRNFRLYLSSKLHKNNPLLLARQNQFVPPVITVGAHHRNEQDIFSSSLVTHTQCSEETRILQYDSPKTGRLSHGGATRVGVQDSSHEGFTQRKDFLEGHGCTSPFPEIDLFIQSLVSASGHKGRIRHWTYFLHKETLIYDILGYRWCGNVQREHRSNNIMYVVDLQQALYYQKCHDPDCQAVSYKSDAKDVPYHLLPASFFDNDFGSDGEFEAGDSDSDADLLAAADLVEAELSPATGEHQSCDISADRGDRSNCDVDIDDNKAQTLSQHRADNLSSTYPSLVGDYSHNFSASINDRSTSLHLSETSLEQNGLNRTDSNANGDNVDDDDDVMVAATQVAENLFSSSV